MSGAAFATSVVATSGVYPDAPVAWSYSSMKEVEACPRRWMLSRASYPELWDGMGYPGLPSSAGLFGDVVHAVLERIVKAMVSEGCPATGSATAVEVLRSLGGYTAVITQAIEARLERLHGNPRLSDERIRRIGIDLYRRVPEARAKVQASLMRTTLPDASAPPRPPREELGSSERGPLAPGAHAEVELRATALRFAGRIDLMRLDDNGAQITDYKTGEPDPAHREQLRTYALLWALDTVANPTHAPTTALTASYGSKLVSIDPPDEDALRSDEGELRLRIDAADAAVTTDSPRAVPSEETCRFCQVRQMCEDYWAQVTAPVTGVHPGNWFDIEGVIAAPNGMRSWLMDTRPGRTRVLLRTAVPDAVKVGDRVRILGARRDEDSEQKAIVVDMTPASELFVLS